MDLKLNNMTYGQLTTITEELSVKARQGYLVVGDLKMFPLIHELIHFYADKARNYLDDDYTTVSECFTWSETEEGHTFWSSIHCGYFVDAYKLQPNLFKVDMKYVNIQYKVCNILKEIRILILNSEKDEDI